MLYQYKICQQQLCRHPTDMFPIYFPSCLLKHRRLYIYSENLEQGPLIEERRKTLDLQSFRICKRACLGLWEDPYGIRKYKLKSRLIKTLSQLRRTTNGLFFNRMWNTTRRENIQDTPPISTALGKADKVVIRESQFNNMAGKMGCKTRKMVIPYVIINTADHKVSGWPVQSHANKGKNMWQEAKRQGIIVRIILAPHPPKVLK